MTKNIIEYVPDFLDYCEIEKGLSHNTIRSYNQNLKVFTDWLKATKNEDLTPLALTKNIVWDYRLYLARTYKTNHNKYLSKKSQNYYLIAVRSLLDFLADRDIETLSSAKIKLAKQDRNENISFMETSEIEKILSAPDVTTIIGIRNRAIMELLFSSGLRVSELAALNKEQMSFLKEETFELSIVGKGKYTRTIFISPTAIEWIRKYLELRKDTHHPLFINHHVMIGKNDNRLTTRMIQKMIAICATVAGINKKITPHTFRHSYATSLLNKGADLRSVQELLGHRNVATTQIYTHVTNKGLREAYNKFH